MASVLQHRAESLDGPFQTEMESTSDDTLLSLKRKSISLNAEGGATELHVTMGSTTFLLSEMSREERRELRKRLKTELKQVQGIVNRLESLEQQVRSSEKEVSSHPAPPLSAAAPPPLLVPPPLEIPRIGRQSSFAGSDGILGTPGTTTSKEKRTPKANQMYSNAEYISAKDKMPPPEKLKPKQFGLPKKPQHQQQQQQQPTTGRTELELKRQKIEAARQKRMQEILKQCMTVLRKLMAHKHAWVFNEPVDVVKLGLHDYYDVIRKPMDLGTIKKKLDSSQYGNPLEFAEDVRLTFSNAMTYNPPGHDVYFMADTIRKLFEERWRLIKDKLDEEQTKIKAEDEVYHQKAMQARQQGRHVVERVEEKVVSETRNRTMTFEEKRILSEDLEKVPADKVGGIVRIIKERNGNLGAGRNEDEDKNEEEIELDIDNVDNDTLWELHKYVANCLREIAEKPQAPPPPPEPPKKSKKKSGHKQSEPVVVEPKTNGPSDSPKKRKVPDGEEDIDIDVDDDMPTANFPPVVIDKDAGNDGSKSSGESSSSSSGSSSSDSDSGSSVRSESEAEGPRTAEPLSPSSEQPVVVENADGAQGTDMQAGNPTGGKQPEREKVLRAALLKGRFAETILKAREKTFPLNKTDKVDPDKLRKEREELERKQREDRARLQAEAKAAQIARKKAEAEAASEARKRREVEREAARRALQQMERTVDADECEILKDFNLMRNASMEQFQSSAGEVSPANSPEGFALAAGGNPLEQLGLFMKLDEEEDEKQGDGEVAYAEGTDENGEVEEGEID